MPDSTATASPTVPPWLGTAIEQYEQRKLTALSDRVKYHENIAATINARLADLGVEPLRPARVDKWGNLEGAFLTPATFDKDTGEGTYEVRAFWDEASDQIALHTSDWEAHPPVHGRVRLLHTLADIAAARNEIPRTPAAPPRDFKAEALRAIDSLNVDALDHHQRQVEAIVTAIHGLTAAVLHAGETITRANDRP